MARQPKPWYWKARNAWYVQIKGKQIKLHAEKEEAEREFHRIMARTQRDPILFAPIKTLPMITAADAIRVRVHKSFGDTSIAIQWALVDGISSGVRLDVVQWARLQSMLREAAKKEFGLT